MGHWVVICQLPLRRHPEGAKHRLPTAASPAAGMQAELLGRERYFAGVAGAHMAAAQQWGTSGPIVYSGDGAAPYPPRFGGAQSG